MPRNTLMIKMIKDYQNRKPFGSGRCVHYPSCSQYGLECYQKFGFFKASFFTLKRIIFCTPLNHKYYDPVPLSKNEKKKKKNLLKQASNFIKIIDEYYKNNVLIEVKDFLILIFESEFGESTSFDIINIDSISDDLVTKILPLDNNYYRVYNPNINITKKAKKEISFEGFYYKIYELEKYIKKIKGLSHNIKKNYLDEIKDYLQKADFSYETLLDDNIDKKYIVIKKS